MLDLAFFMCLLTVYIVVTIITLVLYNVRERERSTVRYDDGSINGRSTINCTHLRW